MSEKVREIYNGRVVRLFVESFELPNGKPATIEMIRHPGAAAVVPLTEERDVLLIRQYRRAASGFIYEVPAGKLDPGEEPEHCALRELEEEAGVRAGTLQALGSIFTTPGFTDEVIHLYLATSLETVRQRLDDDEVLSVERVSFERALQMCVRGELRDAKSICALMLADRLLRS
ncbi:MAG: NUDIX hydrolase [Candidatus Latescibacterota bacterium]|nr:MAG: NUDIX hydrolase [Candidatus Latescibacterota bacterium]